MKHLIKQYDEEIYKSAVLDFYFKDMKIGVFDIETTGLNPSNNKFILGGLYNCSEKTMHQFFAENRSEEAITLAAMMEELAKLDMVVTYNGRHFDIPFVERRRQSLANTLSYAAYANPNNGASPEACRLKELADNIFLPYNLDLYLVLNGHSPIKKFVPNLKQKTVENYMGLWQDRSDEISGAESVDLYNSYEKSGNPALESKILLHNSDDVLQLTRLLKAVSKSDFHKAMFHLGFPVCGFIVEKIRFEKDCLTVTGKQGASPIDYMGFAFGDYPLQADFKSRSASFTMKFPLIRDSGLCIVDLEAAYLDNKDFEKYPSYGSGFLVLESSSGKNYMEINCFIKTFIKTFLDSL